MESRPKKKRDTKRSLTRSFVVTVAVGIPGALLANAGCSSTNNGESGTTGTGPQTPTTPGVASGTCTTEGEQKPCHVNLGMTGNGHFQSCFSGTQTCTGGLWSSCGGDGTVTNTLAAPGLNLASAPSSAAQAGGVHPQAIVTCGNGICDAINVCIGGVRDGNLCTTASDCFGSPCAVLKTCVGGPATGDTCSKDSDCSGGTCTGATETCTSCPQDCGTCAAGPPDASAPICASDPCAPDCQGWAQGVPLSSAAGSAASTVIGVTGFGQINNGQIQKLLLDNLNTGTKCDDFASRGLPSSYYNCQVDTFCSMTQLGGDGNCHQFAIGGVQSTDLRSMGTNPGVDVTIGPGCSDRESDKYRYFPICNRGSVAIPAGTVIRVKYINPASPLSPCPNTSCTATSGFDCSMKVGDTVAKNGSTATSGLALTPGTCQLLDTQEVGMGPGGAACSQPNGDKWIYANCDGATTGTVEGDITMKAGVGPTGVTGAPDNEPVTAPGISGCANNWTDHSSNNNPPSCGVAGQNVVSVYSQYHATCPTGFGVLWDKLIYDSTCPKNGSGTSEVFFEAATAPDVAGAPGALSSYYEIAEAQANNAGNPYSIAGTTLGSDPEQCSFTLPSPQTPGYTWNTCTNNGPGPNPNCCPKDFTDQFNRATTKLPFPGAGPMLGKTVATNPWLSLHIVIKATPDNKKDATLNSYSLSYQCIAQE